MNLLDMIKTGWQQNKIEVLTGLSIVGTALTGYLAFQAGRKAQPILDEAEKDMQYVKKGDKEAKREVIKDTAKQLVPVILPPVMVGAGTIGATIGGTKASSKRIAVLTAAYTLSEKTAKDLNDKLVETLGESKARKIHDSIIKDKVKENPPTLAQESMVVSGEVLCMDVYSGRYFHYDINKLKQCILELSSICQSDMYVSLNDLYILINSDELPPIKMGDDLGWNADDLYKGQIPVVFTSALTPQQRPCLCMDYNVSPRMDFQSLH